MLSPARTRRRTKGSPFSYLSLTVPFCTQPRFSFADFDAYIDIVATF
jgi:hypothetical protein